MHHKAESTRGRDIPKAASLMMMWYDVFCFLYFDLSLRWKTMCWGQFANVLTMYSCVALCAADLWMVEYVQAQIFMKSSLSLGPYDFWDTRKAYLGTQTGEKGWAAKSCKETLSKEIDGGGPQTNLFGRVDLMHRTAHTRPSLSIISTKAPTGTSEPLKASVHCPQRCQWIQTRNFSLTLPMISDGKKMVRHNQMAKNLCHFASGTESSHPSSTLSSIPPLAGPQQIKWNLRPPSTFLEKHWKWGGRYWYWLHFHVIMTI